MTLVFAPRSPCPFTELGRFEGRNHAPRRKGMMALRPRGGGGIPSLSQPFRLAIPIPAPAPPRTPPLSLSLSLVVVVEEPPVSKNRGRRNPGPKRKGVFDSRGQEKTSFKKNLLRPLSHTPLLLFLPFLLLSRYSLSTFSPSAFCLPCFALTFCLPCFDTST